MTIKSITPIALNLPFEVGGPKPLFAGRPRNMEMLLVRVETDGGIVGWGEAFGFAVWPATRAALVTLIAPLAVGRDERDIAGVLNRERNVMGMMPHPERSTEPLMGSCDGLVVFQSMLRAMVGARVRA